MDLFQALDGTLAFGRNLFTRLDRLQIDYKTLHLDHICFRVASQMEYDAMKSFLLENNQLLVEHPVQGRMIATFKLSNPLFFPDRTIDVLELPAPKVGSHYPTGYEHVEFVWPDRLEQLMELYPHLDWDKKGLSKPINRDLRLALDSSCSVKFHEQSLEQVIAKEKHGRHE